MSLKILKTGIFDTVQDLGRYGYQQTGINPGGVMDRNAASIANILVGNELKEAVIEIHFPGPVILFETPAIIALSGADFDASVNNEPVAINHVICIPAGTTLLFNALKKGACCYLAIKGGFKLEKWLKSYSTNMKAGVGGLSGRKLVKDDIIFFNLEAESIVLKNKKSRSVLPWSVNEDFGTGHNKNFLVIPGAEWHWLTQSSKEKFLKNPFYISHNSDRMGFRLASEPLQTIEKKELVSSAVSFGTIQLLPDGQLIILMADHQTTGGYPRIGNIISVHLPLLSQKNAGEQIHFAFTDLSTAENLILKQHQHLHQLQNACKLRLENFLHEMNIQE